jgi:secondary thiamine-phosphate synthase enzyme
MEGGALKQIDLRTTARTQLVNITSKVADALAELDPSAHCCHVFVPHTTAAVVINEAADPDVSQDLAAAYRAMVPQISFAHAEGNSDSHLLATLLGSSVSIPIDNGRLKLGTWQGIFFVDLDGPRNRRVWVNVF